MTDQPGAAWKSRSTAYLLLAVVAALVTASPDVISMLLVWLVGLALFKLGFLVYRHSKGKDRS